MSGHSVEKHLETSPEGYDADIRRFVPGYDAMLEEVVGALAEHLPPAARVIDLGAGTGALSARIAASFPQVRLVLLDADPAMLAQAELRLSAERARIVLQEGSFADPLPECDAAVASLSLHHVPTIEAKRDVYRNIARSLPSGGLLVNADAAIPPSKELAGPMFQRWAAHLVAHGDAEAEAFDRFRQWATEDRYFGIEEELDMIRAAGFEQVDVRWRFGPTSVIVARKK